MFLNTNDIDALLSADLPIVPDEKSLCAGESCGAPDHLQALRQFRKHYVRGLRRLIRQSKLRIGGKLESLNDPASREDWLNNLEQIDWNVFIQGPPNGNSDPANVVKYLAGYLTGGPIAEGRIIEAGDNKATFWARPKKSTSKSKGRSSMNEPRPYRLTGRQFMQQ